MDTLPSLQNYGYLTLFLGLLLEYLGLPIPGEVILLFFGALVYWGDAELWIVVATGLAAVLIGDHFWYIVGRRGGKRWLRWFCRVTLGSAQCMSRTEHLFQRYGAPSLLFAKFVPGFRTFAMPMAGMTGVAYRSFLFFDAVGSLLWLSGATALGMLMATQLEIAIDRVQQLGGTLLVIMALAGIGIPILRLKKRLKYGQPMAKSEQRMGYERSDGRADEPRSDGAHR